MKRAMSPAAGFSRRSMIIGAFGALLASLPVTAQESAKPSARSAAIKAPIQDNSFLIEEAYNQDAGVVQNISSFALARGTRSRRYAFTQEWPLASRRHQVSYTVPFVSTGRGAGSGLGDVAIDYRYQLADGTRTGVLLAPRLSVILPTGNWREERGAGVTGVQTSLPVTVEHSARLVSHWNAGATLMPSARNALGDRATTLGYNAGGSLIWLAQSTLNFMLEAVWASDEVVSAPGQRVREQSFFVAPGVRSAINFSSGLQIVPGIALPIGIGPSRRERRLFLYLSFEDRFRD